MRFHGIKYQEWRTGMQLFCKLIDETLLERDERLESGMSGNPYSCARYRKPV